MIDDGAQGLRTLAERLEGTWRVTSTGIEGQAEYHVARDGGMVVGVVQVDMPEGRMTNIQQISLEPVSGRLLARYLDSLGNEATYAWELDGLVVRVSEVGPASPAFFEATFASDYSEYSGSWHYPDSDAGDDETITYTRV